LAERRLQSPDFFQRQLKQPFPVKSPDFSAAAEAAVPSQAALRLFPGTKKLGEAGWSFSQFDFAIRLKRIAGYFFFLATAFFTTFLAGAFFATFLATFLAGAFLATTFFLTGI
jgi:hypothetical protein